MEELMMMALMYIYPDGTIERIPISNYKFHFNLDLADIVDGYFDFSNKIPLLLIDNPANLRSIEQTNALESIYNSYPKDDIICEKFSEEKDVYFGKRAGFDIEEYMANAKDVFGTRGI